VAALLLSMYVGFGPCLFASVLGWLAATYWIVPPRGSWGVQNLKANLLASLVYAVVSMLTAVVGEMSRRSNAKLVKALETVEYREEELRVAQEQLRRRSEDSLRMLSGRLLQMQDDERRRIARELHDSAGQILAALSMNLTPLESEHGRTSPGAAKAVEESLRLVNELSKDLRTISYLLHPPLLDEVGLSSALRMFVEGFTERSKIKVEFVLSDDFGRLSQDSETTIFRVVQECLTNVHRHSSSFLAKVRIARVDGLVRVEVEDRGKGIRPDKRLEWDSIGTLGVGIRGMRERLRQLGGNLEINSNGEGTVVVALLPATNVSSSAVACRGSLRESDRKNGWSCVGRRR
jgi:signal transduction histidine kinase